MHDRPERGDEALFKTAGWAVYQCVNGCVHVRLNHVVLTFSGGEFAQLAKLIADAYVRLGVRAAVSTIGPH